MNFVGDRHRFGKAVAYFKENGKSWLRKPRSAKLEELFLSHHSQSSSFQDLNAPKLLDFHKNSDWEYIVESIDPHCIDDSTKLSESKIYAQRSGELIAAAALFGFFDLHCENVKICKIGNEITPVPIDLECVFWGMSSGMETYLYPSVLVEVKKCGLAGQFMNGYETKWATPLIDSFLERASLIVSDYENRIENLANDMEGAANRILLRPTREYGELLKAIKTLPKNELTKTEMHPSIQKLEYFHNNPLLIEEWVQLLEGDVPYFFTHELFDSKTLSYFATPEKVATFTPTGFDKELHAAMPSREFYFSEDRIQSLLMNTCLQLAHLYLDKDQNEFRGELFQARRESNGTFTFETEWFSVEG